MLLFTRRKPSVDAVPLQIRRLLDLTMQRGFGDEDPRRSSVRYVRSLPVLLVPWQDSSPVADEALFAVTRNISDHGIGLLLTQPFRARTACLGVCIPDGTESELYFILCVCKHLTPIGGGFWGLGIELTESATDSCPQKLGSLKKLAASLTPPEFESDVPLH